MPSLLTCYRYWGKSLKDFQTPTAHGACHHPAISHMLDVGLVAKALLQQLDPIRRQLLFQPFECSQEETIHWLACLVALHDLGKISPGFQSKVSELFKADSQHPFSLNDETFHGKVTFYTLPSILQMHCGCDIKVGKALANAVGAHHGFFLSVNPDGLLQSGEAGWVSGREAVAEKLLEVFELADKTIPLTADKIATPFLIALAGLTAISDWLGSDESQFQYIGDNWPEDIAAYINQRSLIATQVVKKFHLNDSKTLPPAINFEGLFGYTSPNQCQQHSLAIAQALDGPTLLVVETPTGSGKTEAALAVANQWQSRGDASGLYYALPTQATANQMFGRVLNFLQKCIAHEQNDTELHLLHSFAAFNEQYEELKLSAISGEESNSEIIASEWFAGHKRGLLAPHAVGTVDQSLMAVLQAKHMFVRLFGLIGKVVVIDEVHAYDTYTSTLLDQLLTWLAACNTSVILLSATLPLARRQALVKAWSADAVLPETLNYPSVLGINTQGQVEARHIADMPARTFQLHCIEPEKPEQVIVETLQEQLSEGGCAACIMNTVGEAQALFQYLQVNLSDTQLILFHARFPAQQRLEIEKEIGESFGKNSSNRPRRAVVVATQVLEQSLDVDFDLMISQLAPIDLLLQRAGRLHRHERTRPDKLSAAGFYCILPHHYLQPRPENFKLDKPFHVSELIYESEILLQTALVITQHAYNEIKLPGDVEELIARVYGPQQDSVEQPAHLEELMFELGLISRNVKQHLQKQGKSIVLPEPAPPGKKLNYLRKLAHQLDDKEIQVKARTRLAEPNIAIIVLHEIDGKTYLDSAGTQVIDWAKTPDIETIRALMSQSVTISNKHWYSYFEKRAVPKNWEKSVWLSHCRPAIFKNGKIPDGEHLLKIDFKLGLTSS